MTSGFSMQAMTRSVPPHLGQVSMSMAKTRFRRCIQVRGARGLSGCSWPGLRFGTTDSRCLQFGANTPWNRVRFNRGRGTKAAKAGDEVEWLEDDVGGAVAKRLLEPIDDLSPIVGREPLVGDGGPCDVATELFELVALGGLHRRWRRGAKSPVAWRARWMGRVRTVPGRCARSMPSCRRWARWRSGSESRRRPADRKPHRARSRGSRCLRRARAGQGVRGKRATRWPMVCNSFVSSARVGRGAR